AGAGLDVLDLDAGRLGESRELVAEPARRPVVQPVGGIDRNHSLRRCEACPGGQQDGSAEYGFPAHFLLSPHFLVDTSIPVTTPLARAAVPSFPSSVVALSAAAVRPTKAANRCVCW